MLDIIPQTYHRIGVPLSGGPDSAILYYTLMEENLELGSPYRIIPICAPKIDGADYYASQVNNWVCNRLTTTNDILFIGNPWQAHNVIVRNAVINAFIFDIIDCVVLGDNVPPPDGAGFPGLQPVRERVDSPVVFQPYFDMTKDQIISGFFDQEIEELLAFTHSCTEKPRGACWECWQCTERKWAFTKLGKIDPLAHLT